jgi:hypothetical protein
MQILSECLGLRIYTSLKEEPRGDEAKGSLERGYVLTSRGISASPDDSFSKQLQPKGI